MIGAAKRKNGTVSRLKDAESSHTSLTLMNNILSEMEEVELLDVYIWKYLSWTHLEDKMAKDAGNKLPEKSFTILQPKPAICDLQEHGEIQDGICLISE